MKILKISGKNLASLAGQFEVDFEQEPLASAGLFAISGPTGAGKSTLLDALCLALYDATPRLLKVQGRASNLPDVGSETISPHDTRTLLRRGAADGFAEVDFVGNDGAAYRARWNVRRARGKADGGLQPTTMSLHRLPALQAIGGTKTEVKQEIEQRIGLSFEQFTRAVLLAQNEFSAFLKTDDNERGELLETLTGSAIYTEISKRAYERSKLEQDVLRGLNARLSDQKPLAIDSRFELDAQSAVADAAVTALDERKGILEQQSRWHHEAEKLQHGEQLAHQCWQASVADVEASGVRRTTLATLETVQAARPMVNELARIDTEIAQVQATHASSAAALEQAKTAQDEVTTTLQAASGQLQLAESAQRNAAPQLDLAKTLEARIDAMLPALQQSTETCGAAEQGAAAALAAQLGKEDQKAQADLAQQTGTAWLAQRSHWQELADQWPRWDTLFAQAEQTAALENKATMALASARQEALRCLDAETNAAKQLAGSVQALRAFEAQRQSAIGAVAAFDSASLQRERQALEARRSVLADAEKLWTELSAKQTQLKERQVQSLKIQESGAAADAKLGRLALDAPAIMAALAQAERSLKSAEAACAENVETLRATLTDDQACPVCGATEHPYRHENASLRAMLSSLQSEVTRCSGQAQENIAQLATERTVAAASREQLSAIETEMRTLKEAAEPIARAWTKHALAEDAGADFGAIAPEGERSAWLVGQLSTVQARLLEIGQQELAAQRAGTARDDAQRACDEAAVAHVAIQAAAASAETRLAQLNAEHSALNEKWADTGLQLRAILNELGAAFPRDLEQAWKESWSTGPARFHAARKAEGSQWLAQHKAVEARAITLASIALEHKSICAVVIKAERDLSTVRAALAVITASINAMQLERQALWNGQPVQQVETELHAATELAKAALLKQQSAHQQAQQTQVRLHEALDQAARRQVTLSAAASGAAALLNDWFAQFKLSQGPDSTVGDLDRLRALLSHGAQSIGAERAALQALDAQAASAATVLKERQDQRAQHIALRTALHDHEQSVDSLASALGALAAERKIAHDGATALQLTIAQDNARRLSSRAILLEIEQQEAIEQRWASLNELIGSADGKKFRNYAQQFTLDLLLGYANRHLMQLARRYRLERINNAANPSLGLMVQDQDMGGEMRSVHSLSGGESFLVSLALALGLASLSSNRVRVESLFIDEGFGSLDAETLRVAMDALDGLQSMGRKVGVISHVQEMTDRISTKILVQPGAGGKSCVSVQ